MHLSNLFESVLIHILYYPFFFYRTYGIVYKAINRVTGAQVAIKKFKDSDDDEYVSDSTSISARFNLTNFIFLHRFARQR